MEGRPGRFSLIAPMSAMQRGMGHMLCQHGTNQQLQLHAL